MTQTLKNDVSKDPQRTIALHRMIKDTPTSYSPRALEVVSIDWGGAGSGHQECTKDGAVAYQSALLFWATGNVAFADVSLKILNDWSSKNKVFKGNNAPLEAAWSVGAMARAAELLKYSAVKERWASVEPKFFKWLTDVIAPVLRDPSVWKWKFFNNWHTSIIDARMQIAILREDKPEFEWCVQKYREICPKICTGKHECHISETCRDVTHMQFLLGGLINVAEMAWHQGVRDLYFPKLSNIMEYHASIMMGEVPEGLTKQDIKTPYGYWYEPVWEIGMNHFFGRMKTPMPVTQKWITTFRPERVCFHWGGGTLTHFGRA